MSAENELEVARLFRKVKNKAAELERYWARGQRVVEQLRDAADTINRHNPDASWRDVVGRDGFAGSVRRRRDWARRVRFRVKRRIERGSKAAPQAREWLLAVEA